MGSSLDKVTERWNRSLGYGSIMGRRERVIINLNFRKYKVEGKVRLDWNNRGIIGGKRREQGRRRRTTNRFFNQQIQKVFIQVSSTKIHRNPALSLHFFNLTSNSATLIKNKRTPQY